MFKPGRLNESGYWFLMDSWLADSATFGRMAHVKIVNVRGLGYWVERAFSVSRDKHCIISCEQIVFKLLHSARTCGKLVVPVTEVRFD